MYWLNNIVFIELEFVCEVKIYFEKYCLMIFVYNLFNKLYC